ncbi:uncharacterized protein PV09_04633 [Verruconis gallopava]|uniref:Major facilitator superfamily (MFS) profile domain-containing protein n=1 Tax=Verruconis gallopava TaxID=253628 RepID=A0A0D2ABW8_9PEZI|nr:uncharacterized protein PV09_04633 [Verruconis gallopava]KIW04343.1 hypothetical protein PV09_04633 [Verruconis gallopava]
MAVVSEKDVEKGEAGVVDQSCATPSFEPIQTRDHPLLSKAQTRQSARSQRSHGGEDGYSCRRDSEEIQIADVSGDDKQFEVKWDGDNDPMNPRSRSKFRKWIVVLIMAGSALCVTCASALYTLTYGQLTKEFHVSRLVATLGLSLFVAGLGTGPMFLGPLSEFYGRRPIFIWSYLLYVIWLIPSAVAKNIETMLIARFFDGLAGSAFLSVAGGTVGDLFAKNELSLPMMVYTASPFIGPEVGPLLGGFINQYANWRWSFYVLIIWAGIQWLLILTLVPETYHPVLLRRKAIKLRASTGEPRYRAPIEMLDRSIAMTVATSCYRPFQLLFLEPMCFLICLLSALLLGILYLFFGAFPLVFQHNHGFQLWQLGLCFLGLFIGMMTGIATDVFWKRNYARLVRNYSQETGVENNSEPEFRLPSTIVGAWVVPAALFGFAWTTYPSVHWIVPIVFSGIFGMGVIFVYSGAFTFLVDCYPVYAASALAANSFARSYFAAAFPLFGVQMYNKLGYQWATSLLAFLALALAPFPYLFFKYGKRLRRHSRFAITAL